MSKGESLKIIPLEVLTFWSEVVSETWKASETIEAEDWLSCVHIKIDMSLSECGFAF